MNVLYQQLYGMVAMSAMDAKIEEQLGHNISDTDRALLTKIYESNDLDERCAYLACALGYSDQAKFLFDRVATKRNKTNSTEPSSDFLS